MRGLCSVGALVVEVTMCWLPSVVVSCIRNGFRIDGTTKPWARQGLNFVERCFLHI